MTVLDGDEVRRLLSYGLGFSRDDRDTNIRRIGCVTAEVARHGGVAVVAPIAPFAATWDRSADRRAAGGDLVLVSISTPLEECERRDRKGLYARARPARSPTSPASPRRTSRRTTPTSSSTRPPSAVEDAVEQVWDYLVEGGWISERPAGGAIATR